VTPISSRMAQPFSLVGSSSGVAERWPFFHLGGQREAATFSNLGSNKNSS
jgi:hypothetical protein